VKGWVERMVSGDMWMRSRGSRIESTSGRTNFLDKSVGIEMNIGGRKAGEQG